MGKKNPIIYFPYAFSSLLCILYISKILLTPEVLNDDGSVTYQNPIDEVVFATIVNAAVLLLLILNKRIWKHVFFVNCLLTFSPFFSFSNINFFVGIGPLNINMISLVFSVSHLMLNPDVFSVLRFLLNTNKSSLKEEVNEDSFKKKVKTFEKKFSNKTAYELEIIANDSSRIPEAIEAAKNLLKENESLG